MDRVCIYLRKSRTDEEIERELGEGETLAKHRKALLKFSKENHLDIVKIREEIVSGESLIHRPQMLELLKEVEQGIYGSVLVMDMERLGRGNMQEQGLILDTFKKSKTKIITLRKTYDLNNDFDEEYSEFEAFMSRKEFKMINRRLQGGRIRSVEEGNYIGAYPPYGYIINVDKHTRTLTPHPDQSEVVKLIFDLYVNQDMGAAKISEELTKRGCRTYTGADWDRSVISNILKNPVYTGKILWKRKCIRKSADPNKSKDTYTRPQDEWIISNGKHPALVSNDVFNRAQEIIKGKYHVPYQSSNGMSNPLAGVIICKICGSKMKYRPYGNKEPHIVCIKKCGNKSSKFKHIEAQILLSLEELTRKYALLAKENPIDENNQLQLLNKNLHDLESETISLNKQKLKLHDLLESGVYDVDTFKNRSKNIADRLETISKNIEYVKLKITSEEKRCQDKNILPKLMYVLDVYKNTDDIVQKNKLLKSVIEKADYLKNKEQKDDNFTLIVYPKIPE
ncbi:MAG: recombinase family protein [Bacillota bacterium]|nr:recombinase family protein [Bacillota bacterium]